MKRMLMSLSALFLTVSLFAQKWDNLAPTPPMGWNSWNCFRWEIDEEKIRGIADRMEELGLIDAGYVYLNIDDAWHGQRDSLGFIHADSVRFPSGMKALGDYIHAKGLKFGLYSDAGSKTCACFAGSLGHEYQDAYVYAKWGVDYVKYDFCYTEDINCKGAYKLMSKAIRASGRPMILSICEGGYHRPWEWGGEIAQLWRTTVDIGPAYNYEGGRNEVGQLGFTAILDLNEPLRAYAGPGHWNDPDMLEVGNGMTFAEDRAHFSLWCMMAAPLLMGNDLRTITDETLSILTNRKAIAVDQDPLGIQGFRLRTGEDGVEYWFRPLAGGDWAVCLFNRTQEARKVALHWDELDLTDSLSGLSTSFGDTLYRIVDIWNADAKPAFTGRKGRKGTVVQIPMSVEIRAHDVAFYRLVRQ